MLQLGGGAVSRGRATSHAPTGGGLGFEAPAGPGFRVRGLRFQGVRVSGIGIRGKGLKGSVDDSGSLKGREKSYAPAGGGSGFEANSSLD